MHRHCIRSNLRHLDYVKASSSSAFRALSSRQSSVSGAGFSQTPARRHIQSLQHSVAQAPANAKEDPLDILFKGHDNDPAFAPTGNISQDALLEDDSEAVKTELCPGSFVEIRRNDNALSAIYLGEIRINQRVIAQSLCSRGSIFTHYPSDVHFTIPNFISASLAERCGIGEATPENGPARVHALRRLQKFVSEVDNEAAGMEQQPLNSYIEVMDPDETKWTTTTVAHVTRLFYEIPTFLDYYMIHRYLISQPLYYLATPNYLHTQQFYVRPRRDIKEITKVTEDIYKWRRGLSSPFPKFVDKARNVIQEYDKRRKCGPISQIKLPVAWSKDDQVFINFLLRSLQPHRSNQLDPYTMGRTELVKAILRPTSPVTDSLTHELVVKLGVIAPWQDLHEFIPTLNPWGDFTFKKTLESEGDDIVKASLAPKAKPTSILGPMDFHPADPLDSVRHDFGDMKVYVIDSATAKELDDGVSLERIPNEPDNYWVHVHVADPTSLIHPHHALATIARQRVLSSYLSQRTIPLFPSSLVYSPEFSLSLGQTNEKAGTPTRVMSFSIKLDRGHNIVDYKVRAGIIRNVVKATYDEVDTAIDQPPSNIWYPLGGSAPPKPPTKLNKSDIEDLRVLMDLASGQQRKVVDGNLFQYITPTINIYWNEKVPENVRSPSLNANQSWESSLYHGFPDLTYEVDNNSSHMGSHVLVAEMMKLANRTASRFFLDHNVPCLRHWADAPVAHTPSGMDEILNARSQYGIVPEQLVLRNIAVTTGGRFCLEPKQHFHLGVKEGEGYVRATSPLRRYEDMVTHWQLKHILLGEKSPRPPFSSTDLEKMITEIEPIAKAQLRLSKQNTLFYSLLCLKRFEDETVRREERPDVKPLGSLDAFTRGISINSTNSSIEVSVYIPFLGLPATLVDVPNNFMVPPGTDLQVKIKSIDLGIKRTRLLVSLAE